MTVKLKKIKVKRVTRVALVDQGANLMPGLFKRLSGDQETLELVPLMKEAPDEEGILRCIVYAPMMLDAHGHYMDAEGVKTACHSFGASGMSLDLMHGKDALDKSKVAVVESCLLMDTDDRYPTVDHMGRTVPHKGAWAMATQFFDKDLLKKARSGELNELSLSCPKGEYEFIEPTPEELALLKSATPPDDPKGSDHSPDMDEKQFEALTKGLADMAVAVKVLTDDAAARKAQEKSDKEALDKAKEAKDAQTKKDALDKKLDISDPVALKKIRFAAAVTGLQKEYEIEDEDVTSLDAEDLDGYIGDLEKLRDEHGMTKKKGSSSRGLRKRSKDIESDNDDEISAESINALQTKLAKRHSAANDKAMRRVAKQEA